MKFQFLQSILSEADGTGSTKRTAVLWTAIPIWTFINIMAFATNIMKELRPTLMFYDFAFMVSGLGIIALEKIFTKPTILPGEEGAAPAHEQASNITAASGAAPSLPILLLIAVSACLFTGCARKVALNKTSETDTRQLTAKTVDTSKSTYSITQTQQAYYGGIVNGTLFFADPTNNTTTNTPTNAVTPAQNVGGGLPKTDSIEANGIKIKVALLPVLGGFKARITAIETPVSVTNTTTQTGTMQKGVTQTNAETDKKTVVTKAKTTETKGLPWGWLIAAAGMVVIIIFVIKKYAK